MVQAEKTAGQTTDTNAEMGMIKRLQAKLQSGPLQTSLCHIAVFDGFSSPTNVEVNSIVNDLWFIVNGTGIHSYGTYGTGIWHRCTLFKNDDIYIW